MIHAAAVYEVGIPVRAPAGRCAKPTSAAPNGCWARRWRRRSRKVVYVSTVGIFGNTNGRSSTRATNTRASSSPEYEKTKWEAHQVAKRLIGEGLPCVIVQPGGVYGPGDTSSVGALLDQFLSGKMPLIPFPDLGICLTHVEDIAAGIILALDKGSPGETYVISGPVTTVREAIEIVAAETGKKAPKHALPTGLMKATDPDRPAGRETDGTAAEPARADRLRRRRHLLGEPRQGDAASSVTSRVASKRACAPTLGRRRQTARRLPPLHKLLVDARHRCGAPRPSSRDRLLGGRRDAGRPRPGVLPAHAAGEARRSAAARRSCSPTSTSTTPPRPVRWSPAGPTCGSTCTSAARRT